MIVHRFVYNLHHFLHLYPYIHSPSARKNQDMWVHLVATHMLRHTNQSLYKGNPRNPNHQPKPPITVTSWRVMPQKNRNLLAILCDLFGMVKWPFKGLSDLQLGNQKVTLNHLAIGFSAHATFAQAHRWHIQLRRISSICLPNQNNAIKQKNEKHLHASGQFIINP